MFVFVSKTSFNWRIFEWDSYLKIDNSFNKAGLSVGCIRRDLSNTLIAFSAKFSLLRAL